MRASQIDWRYVVLRPRRSTRRRRRPPRRRGAAAGRRPPSARRRPPARIPATGALSQAIGSRIVAAHLSPAQSRSSGISPISTTCLTIPRIESELDEALTASQAFRERYRGKLGELSAAELNDAVAEVERIRSASTRVETYARLRQAADSSDQARGALVQKVRERNTQIETESSSSTSNGARSTTTRPSGSSRIPRSTRTPRSCAPSAATSRTCSPSRRRGSRPRRASPVRAPGAASSTSSSPSSPSHSTASSSRSTRRSRASRG